ncbi:response regulator, partial [Xanthomonas campestris]|nr:response regulator [Xanthomonas campestris]MCC8690151.1 response regulator [Xanthomonas campestris]
MFPVATPRSPTVAPPTMTSMDMQQPCVLVVDDDPDLRKLIGEFLSAHGYQVDVAENVAEMRKRITQRRPDLIVLDVMMPG